MKFAFSHDELDQMQKSRWLTLRERQIFQWYYLDGIRIEDIAARLDLNRSTVSRDLKKIRNKTMRTFL